MSVATQSDERLAPAGRIWQTGLLAAAVAAVINLVIYFIAQAAGVNFNFMPPEMPAPPFAMAVIFATFVGVLLGTLVFSLMPRFSQRPVSTFRIVAIVALVLSFAQPFLLTTGMMPTAGPVGIGTVLVLELMHLVAGAAAIYFLTTRGRA
jgi:lysylphosphatidylglycerol synthetase-like protein (DUF2156 family)